MCNLDYIFFYFECVWGSNVEVFILFVQVYLWKAKLEFSFWYISNLKLCMLTNLMKIRTCNLLPVAHCFSSSWNCFFYIFCDTHEIYFSECVILAACCFPCLPHIYIKSFPWLGCISHLWLGWGFFFYLVENPSNLFPLENIFSEITVLFAIWCIIQMDDYYANLLISEFLPF